MFRKSYNQKTSPVDEIKGKRKQITIRSTHAANQRKAKQSAPLLKQGDLSLNRLDFVNQAYLNILKVLQPKNENFQIKIQIFFIFLLKT